MGLPFEGSVLNIGIYDSFFKKSLKQVILVVFISMKPDCFSPTAGLLNVTRVTFGAV